MDAPILRFTLVLLSLFISTGATYRTPNFTVTAASQGEAKQVGDAAEIYRRDLAQFWLNRRLPNWSRPCTLKVRSGAIAASGETKFQFVGGEVLNWNMYVKGSLERILDSVLPHEINHTIFACHFRRPLPRWADEGAATLFEHRSEQLKQLELLKQVLNSPRDFITLPRLLAMKEYPRGYRPMLIMYAEGFALADFLVQQGGRRKYLKFMEDGERIGWTQAIKANYHHGGVEQLQKNWRSWIMAGMPQMTEHDRAIASNDQNAVKHSGLGVARPAILDEYQINTTIRLQSDDRKRSESPTVAVKPAVLPQKSSVRAPRSREKSGSLKGAVFFNIPGKRPSAAKVRESSATTPAKAPYRSAAIQAPAPRRTAGPRKAHGLPSVTPAAPQRSTGQFLPMTSSVRRGLESTGLSDPSSIPSDSQRKHLPQERRAVTGSIPQWAGFPGQKELF